MTENIDTWNERFDDFEVYKFTAAVQFFKSYGYRIVKLAERGSLGDDGYRHRIKEEL